MPCRTCGERTSCLRFCATDGDAQKPNIAHASSAVMYTLRRGAQQSTLTISSLPTPKNSTEKWGAFDYHLHPVAVHPIPCPPLPCLALEPPRPTNTRQHNSGTHPARDQDRISICTTTVVSAHPSSTAYGKGDSSSRAETRIPRPSIPLPPYSHPRDATSPPPPGYDLETEDQALRIPTTGEARRVDGRIHRQYQTVA